jgi:aminomuconate-semialdehyde/2-hydroxymuconate-6-semialdehyde dehydrogenase
MKKIQNYIDGKLISPLSEKYFDNYEPATGKVYSEIPDSDASDIDLAVESAKKAFETWSQTSQEYRHDLLMKLVKLIEENHEELSQAESRDNGKPLSLARKVDIPRAATNFKFFASAITHFSAEAHEMDGQDVFNFTLRRPIGVVGCISPWNLPLYLFTWKIAPALAAGNCVIAKPSEVTPMTAFLLSELATQAGFPEGVLNIIHGYGHKVGDAITRHPDIKAISFTGGTETGATIAQTVAPMFKKLSLELGGKNPNVIFADCNWSEMMRTTLLSSFANQGQICLCGSRIFVERPIYEKFKIEFVDKVSKLRVGDPLEEDSKMGALVSASHQEKVLSYISLAKEEGGRVLTGGNKVEVGGRCEGGYFLAPTVIEGLDYKCRTNQEEIFGPVVTITPFDHEDEVLKMVNSTQYGLSSTIWTQDISRANRVASKIQTGIVWINCWMVRDLRILFGGMKSSGVGREGGFESLKFFTEAKNVCVKW